MLTTALMSLAVTVVATANEPIPVEVVRTADGWQLLRGGQPYYVKGVGGTQYPDRIAAAGANSVRTWGADHLGRDLDAAHRHGLTVTAGLWLLHGHHMDYTNAEQIAAQRERVRQAVEAHHRHPALLIWGLGNEMEMNNDTPTLWTAVNDLALMIKEIDPHHPVMTVVAEVSREKIERIQRYAPAIDILGVNSYGGLPTLPARLKEFGWEKPWMVTEFGPLGPWERPKTPWGAALEQTSSEKAAYYLSSYQNSIAAHAGQNLGSYVFLWGEKQETTPTWFGMFLQTGEMLETVDVMQYAWTGFFPEHRAPQVRAFEFEVAARDAAPGQVLRARFEAHSPNRHPLRYQWILKREVTDTRFAGEGEQRPGVVTEFSESGSVLEFTAPSEPGLYRLYAYVRDGHGKAATANAPFRVVAP